MFGGGMGNENPLRGQFSRGASRTTQSAFQGRIISWLRGVFSVVSVNDLGEEVRKHFPRSTYWIVDASKLETFDKGAREVFLKLLQEFSAAGGKGLVLHSTNQLFAMVIQRFANNANIRLTLVRSGPELSALLQKPLPFETL